jgi:N-acetylglucosaminyl-diphospho-decaprenol L-rhamnosyltransferase
MVCDGLNFMKVSVLIVSYNTCALLDACLTSVARETRCAHEVIVVDNASQDASAAMVRDRHPYVKLVENQENVGFAAANNQASRLAEGHYWFFLNPDTVILDSAIDRLVAFLDAHPGVGVCGPCQLDASGRPVTSVFRFPTFWSSFWGSLSATPLRPIAARCTQGRRYLLDGVHAQDVDSVQGSGLMIRADLFRQIRSFDECFFMYYEEIELCYRVRKAHQRVVYVPWAALIHYGGASAQLVDEVKVFGNIGLYVLQSRYYFLRKTYGVLPSFALRATDLLVAAMLAAGSLGRRDPQRQTRLAALAKLYSSVALTPMGAGEKHRLAGNRRPTRGTDSRESIKPTQ